jgi:hypothetical protein
VYTWAVEVDGIDRGAKNNPSASFSAFACAIMSQKDIASAEYDFSGKTPTANRTMTYRDMQKTRESHVSGTAFA